MSKEIKTQYCDVCSKEFQGVDPDRCCDGRECGCMGLPIDPSQLVCSSECYDELMKPKKEVPMFTIPFEVAKKAITNDLPKIIETTKLKNTMSTNKTRAEITLLEILGRLPSDVELHVYGMFQDKEEYYFVKNNDGVLEARLTDKGKLSSFGEVEEFCVSEPTVEIKITKGFTGSLSDVTRLMKVCREIAPDFTKVFSLRSDTGLFHLILTKDKK